MTYSTLYQWLFIGGLMTAAALAWRVRMVARGRFFALVLGVWLLGLLAVSSALHSRGPLWLTAPVRSYKYELGAGRAGSLGKHHTVIAPQAAQRLPAEFFSVDTSLSMTAVLQLEVDGGE